MKRRKFILSSLICIAALCVNAQVAYDATTSGGRSTGDFSFSHTPVGTPRAVVVYIMQAVGTTNEIDAITYGGVSVSHVQSSPVIHSTGETGTVSIYFLGAGIPTGTQTMVVDVNATGSDKAVRVITLTATMDTKVHNTVTLNSDSQANPSVNLSRGGITSWVGLLYISGHDNTGSISPLSGWTGISETDFGTQTGGQVRHPTVTNTDLTCGWNQTAEDATMIAVAVTEAPRKIINVQ